VPGGILDAVGDRRVDRIALIGLVACGASAEPRLAPSSGGPTRHSCVVEDRGVALDHVLLTAEPPASDAMSWEPFAQLRGGERVRLELIAQRTSFVPMSVETSVLRLRGYVTADAVDLFPGVPSLFGDMLVPLASNRLHWREVHNDEVLVAPELSPGVRTTIPAEWRSCGFLHLRQRPRFSLEELAHRTQRLALPAGGYLLSTSPEASDDRVSLDLSGREKIWQLETRGSWTRLLLESSVLAVIGWLDRRDGPGPSLGHGSGTGTGAANQTCVAGTVICDAALPLFVEHAGTMREIGSINRGTAITIGRVHGDYTDIVPCDPQVTLLKTVSTTSRAAVACHERTATSSP